ncbi:hypothetical protein AB3X96_35385 [Paraburkholderia sp. BR13439]|uniref:hypothetical protein n=1 Tax=Paraburkholderia sp. BR13439 TaxID=3236996 RepID=UPI0034CE762F
MALATECRGHGYDVLARFAAEVDMLRPAKPRGVAAVNLDERVSAETFQRSIAGRNDFARGRGGARERRV